MNSVSAGWLCIRFNKRVLDTLVDPLVNGIFAGAPHHTLPSHTHHTHPHHTHTHTHHAGPECCPPQ